MGNRRRAREWQKQQELLEAMHNARSIPRSLDHNVRWPGIGLRVLQVVYYPSFEPGSAWDIRMFDDYYKIYRGTIACESQHGTQIVGYSELDVPSEELWSFWSSLCSLAVNLSPLYNEGRGLDGVSYQLALFGDLHSSVRFAWWEEGPPEWTPLVDITNRMIDCFKSARESGEPANP